MEIEGKEEDEELYDQIRLLLEENEKENEFYEELVWIDGLGRREWTRKEKKKIAHSLQRRGEKVRSSMPQRQLVRTVRWVLANDLFFEAMVRRYEKEGRWPPYMRDKARWLLHREEEKKEEEGPPRKKRRLGCLICGLETPIVRQEVARPEREYCSEQCQRKYHFFEYLMQAFI